jgi:hypothetical protein
MPLSGDNRKIFVDDAYIYRIDESQISRYDRRTLGETHRGPFPNCGMMKEIDGLYYVRKHSTLEVYRSLLEKAMGKLEIAGGFLDFHVHSDRVFHVRQSGKRLFVYEGDELVTGMESRVYHWDGAFLHLQRMDGLYKYDLIRRKESRVLEETGIQCLTAKDDVLVYASKGSVIHCLSRGEELTFHSHPRPILRLALTYSRAILAVCKDGKLTLTETKRSERRILAEFSGRVVDFLCSGTDVFLLTTFSLIVYDIRSNCIAGEFFTLPRFSYCKPHSSFPVEDECFEGEEIFKRNVGRTEVGIPYVYNGDAEPADGECVVAIAGDHAFEYSTREKRIKRIARLEGQRCYFSGGLLIGVGRATERSEISAYRFEKDRLVLVKSEECCADLGRLRDVLCDGRRFYLLISGNLYLLRNAMSVEKTRHEEIKEIVESRTGALVLDEWGVSMLDGEYILRDRGITGLKLDGDILYTSTHGRRISRFRLEDDAAEEVIIKDHPVSDFSARGKMLVLLDSSCVTKIYDMESKEVERVNKVDGRVTRILGTSFGVADGCELHQLFEE